MDKPTVTAANWTETLTGETLLFSVLAKTLYVYPEKEWIASLMEDDFLAEAPFGSSQPLVVDGLALLRAWHRAGETSSSGDKFDALCADYTRLFIGPGKVLAPPWESVYCTEERLLFLEQTLQVRHWYARFGLQSAKLHQEPDDHIGLELEFLAHLARLGLQALQTEKSERFDESIDSQRQFLLEHTLQWAPVWCDIVQTAAKTEFYRGIARLTLGALTELAAILDLKIPEAAR
jgi:putative dimethyl sulfoxide reductase chaperone